MTRPNIFLLVFDTLRPDYLGCYGAESVQTYGIDSMASRGIVYENAFSAGPATIQSHAALFTGRYPSETGVVGAGHKLPDDVPTIASWLRDEGYDTYGICGPGKISREFGFAKGFDTYREVFSEHIEPELSTEYFRNVLEDSLVRRDFIRTLREGLDQATNLKFDLIVDAVQTDIEAPFFLFANLLTPHTPYDPPRPFKEEATPSLNRPRWYLLQFLLERLIDYTESLAHPEIRDERLLAAAQALPEAYRFYSDPDWLNETELTVLQMWYTACVEYLSAQFARCMETLANDGILDDTIFILTADHGEYLGDHQMLYHGYCLYDSVLHVPLILAGPSIESDRRLELVSHIDIFETICDLCEIAAPETRGDSIIGSTGREAIYAEYGIRDPSQEPGAAFFDADVKNRVRVGRKCIRTTDYKFVLRSDGEQILRDVQEDERDITAPDTTAELRARLESELTTEFDPILYSEEQTASDSVVENLRELGYLK